eukprot:TRINITY_DN2812_c0_g1_i1.p1 TRINITY_DN2812_c0_g1~~TRINITY_DN2812_c0_g1_i1.p1  ORF type:complete len:163 (+),score=15.79 TRINITY_DN2812_c0_g1_i1:118-606(+)
MAATRAAQSVHRMARNVMSKDFVGKRVFLPEWNVVLVRPSANPMRPRKQPPQWDIESRGGLQHTPKKHQRTERQPNDVVFRVDMKMNKPEIKDYLQAIYGIEVKDVRTQIVLGQRKLNRRKNIVNKRSDYKLAYVSLPENQYFPFPDREVLFEETSDTETAK